MARRHDQLPAGGGQGEDHAPVALRPVRSGDPPVRSRLRPVLLANFSVSMVKAMRELLAAQPAPSPQLWMVPIAAQAPAQIAAGGTLVVRDVDAVGLSTIEALVRVYRPDLVLAIVRSVHGLRQLRNLGEVPFVLREHPLSPPDLVLLLQQLSRP